ncbi:hypothetical protein [Campylobacter helveticus]|uniref:hypothetical protein n=1 Tax=Campylobacter helveticus TaxID=28898 RepID=UPI001115F2D1|nr:hypothetical protein [Campylobacter helveticus]TNH33501.1 hypothetical protein FDW46_06730 [Campylobacter helveticus]
MQTLAQNQTLAQSQNLMQNQQTNIKPQNEMKGQDDKKLIKKPYCFYLNQFDKETLESICKQHKMNKSAFLRKAIANHSYYINAINQIELYNKNIKELAYQIKKCGINLNQIAYHLQIDINEKEESLNKTTLLFKEFKELIYQHEKLLKPLSLDIKQLKHKKIYQNKKQSKENIYE